jgi:hypothetical protein
MRALLAALLRRAPGSRENARDLAALELALLGALKRGLREAERLVRDLGQGLGLEPVEKARGRRRWSALLDARRRLEVSLMADRTWQAAWVRYERVRPARRLTPRQARIDALQQEFYERYAQVGAKAYASPPRRITRGERVLLLVGDLEAGVNNGGFSTYLANKGRRRARETVLALRSIGAARTARMLERALAPGMTGAQLGSLDARFYRTPEDLAKLAALSARAARAAPAPRGRRPRRSAARASPPSARRRAPARA